MIYRLAAALFVLVAIGLFGGFVAISAVLLLVVAFKFFLWSFGKSTPQLPPPSSRRIARLRVWLSTASYIEGDNLVMRITNEQKVKVTVAPKTAGGHPASIDGAVTFTSSDETIARIEVIDGTSANVVGVTAGAALISASFEAQLF